MAFPVIPTTTVAVRTLPENQYVTPAVLVTLTQSQSHISGTPTPPAPAAPPTGASLGLQEVSAPAGVSLKSPDSTPAPPLAPVESSAGASSASQEIPVATRDPAMDKYYAPVACPPLPAHPSQGSTYTWPDSAEDVELGSAMPGPAPAPVLDPASDLLFYSPSPLAAIPHIPISEPLFLVTTPLMTIAPVPATSAAKRALSSLAMGHTLAEDLMDLDAGIPLPSLQDPVLRNPLTEEGDKEDALLFGHIKPLQGNKLIRAAGVLPEELVPRPQAASTEQKAPASHSSVLVVTHTTPPTQEPLYIVQPPSDTYHNPSLSQSLAHLAGLFPSASSETFTLVLNKVNGDLSAASTWMQSVTDVTRAKTVLVEAFPGAPVKEVESALRLCKGDFLLSFYRLTRNFEHTAEWNDFKQVRAKGVMDIDTPAPDFVYDDPVTEAYEWQWWQIAVSVRCHQVADVPGATDLWSRLAGVSTATREIMPHFVEYVYRLGVRSTAEADFTKAVRTLWAQPDFKAIEAVAGAAVPCGQDDPRDAATVILQVMLSDGYISPPAAAWLAIRVSGSSSLYAAMSPLFVAFPIVQRKLWNDCNLHLAAWSITNMKARGGTNSPTGSRISAVDTKAAYSSIIPTSKGKEIHLLFSRTAKKKELAPAATCSRMKVEKEKKRKTEVAAARLAKKGTDILEQMESERTLMREEEEIDK